MIPTQVFSCKYCKTFKNTFFYRTPLVATSEFPSIFCTYHNLQSILYNSWIYSSFIKTTWLYVQFFKKAVLDKISFRSSRINVEKIRSFLFLHKQVLALVSSAQTLSNAIYHLNQVLNFFFKSRNAKYFMILLNNHSTLIRTLPIWELNFYCNGLRLLLKGACKWTLKG